MKKFNPPQPNDLRKIKDINSVLRRRSEKTKTSFHFHSPSATIKLIVGIGNPGEKYEFTHHNTGLLFISFINENNKERLNFKTYKSGEFSYAKLGDIFIAHSLAFMNNSGGAIFGIMKFLNVKPKEVLIVHDDSDILLGKYKICFGRGAAGHRGISSIIERIGTKSFWRLRIGIRKTVLGEVKKAGSFVLKKISRDDRKKFAELFREISVKLNLM